jgi:DNA-directed RNA polymerase sigma subunit (sigma70/sigma32)
MERVTFAIVLSKPEKAALREMAAFEGISMSTLVRRCVQQKKRAFELKKSLYTSWQSEELDAIEKLRRYKEFLSDLYGDSCLEFPDSNETIEIVEKLLQQLLSGASSSVYVDVLRLRYGLGDNETTTLKGTMKILNLPTRERVRNIQQIALRRLRHPARKQWILELYTYVDDTF